MRESITNQEQSRRGNGSGTDEGHVAEKLRMAWDNFEHDAADDEADARRIADVKRRIDRVVDALENRRSISRIWRMWGTVAAVLVPLLAAGMLWMVMGSGATSYDQYATVSTGEGERATVVMTDGTEIVLNAGSRLCYPVAFAAGETRRVEFAGEGYFKVAKLEGVPFDVITPDVEVRVLGTSFNMEAYEDGPSVDVALDNGKVEMVSALNSGRKVTLAPGQIGQFDRKSGEFTVRDVNTSGYSSWRRHQMTYFEVSPDSLIASIEKHYSITLSDEIKGCVNDRFTGSLPDDDLPETLVILSKIYHFELPSAMIGYRRD